MAASEPDDGFAERLDEMTMWCLYKQLGTHILSKGWQAGAVVGCVVVVPVVAFRHWRAAAAAPPLAPRALRALATSAGVGVAASAAMGAATVTRKIGTDRGALSDRVYRLHYNKGQNRTDLFANLGLAAGAGLAAVLLGPSAAVVLGGAAAGTTAGIAAHCLTSPDLRRASATEWEAGVKSM